MNLGTEAIRKVINRIAGNASISIEPPTLSNLNEVLLWRDQAKSSLRTSRSLTELDQIDYFRKISSGVSDRFFSFYSDGEFIGFSGIENISWENRIGEISAIISPKLIGRGYGRIIVNEVLRIGFDELNLMTIWGESYLCSQSSSFWVKIISENGAYKTVLKDRKYWGGRYYDAIYFSFNALDRTTKTNNPERGIKN